MKRVLLLILVICIFPIHSYAETSGSGGYSKIWPSQGGITMVEKNGLYGAVNAEGREIIAPIYDCLGLFYRGITRVRLNGKYGLVNDVGTILAQPKYDYISFPQHDQTPSGNPDELFMYFTYGNLFGLMDLQGNILGNRLFDAIDICESDGHLNIANGCVAVCHNGLWGLMDKTGTLRVPTEWASIGSLDDFNQLYVISNGEQMGVIDSYNHMIALPQWDSILGFGGYFHHNAPAYAIQKNDRWGFVTPTGQVVVSPQYEEVRDFSEGLAAVRSDGKYGFVNIYGEIVIDMLYDRVSSFYSGMAVVQYGQSHFVINTVGNRLFELPGDHYFACDGFVYLNMLFADGTRSIRILDSTGKELVSQGEFDYLNVGPDGNQEDLLLAGKNSKYCIIDRSGNILGNLWFDDIAFGFSDGELFSDGFACVQVNKKWGYIDKAGKWLLEPQFSYAYAFDGGKTYAYNMTLDSSGKNVASSYDIGDKQFNSSEIVPYANGMEILQYGLDDVQEYWRSLCLSHEWYAVTPQGAIPITIEQLGDITVGMDFFGGVVQRVVKDMPYVLYLNVKGDTLRIFNMDENYDGLDWWYDGRLY